MTKISNIRGFKASLFSGIDNNAYKKQCKLFRTKYIPDPISYLLG